MDIQALPKEESLTMPGSVAPYTRFFESPTLYPSELRVQGGRLGTTTASTELIVIFHGN